MCDRKAKGRESDGGAPLWGETVNVSENSGNGMLTTAYWCAMLCCTWGRRDWPSCELSRIVCEHLEACSAFIAMTNYMAPVTSLRDCKYIYKII